MKCFNCKFDLAEWEDITEKVNVRMKVTTTVERLGYITLVDEYNAYEIGSFRFETEHNFKYYTQEDMYKVLFDGGEATDIPYFKVYRKRKSK